MLRYTGIDVQFLACRLIDRFTLSASNVRQGMAGYLYYTRQTSFSSVFLYLAARHVHVPGHPTSGILTDSRWAASCLFLGRRRGQYGSCHPHGS
jgi:hypothetical protein